MQLRLKKLCFSAWLKTFPDRRDYKRQPNLHISIHRLLYYIFFQNTIFIYDDTRKNLLQKAVFCCILFYGF